MSMFSSGTESRTPGLKSRPVRVPVVTKSPVKCAERFIASDAPVNEHVVVNRATRALAPASQSTSSALSRGASRIRVPDAQPRFQKASREYSLTASRQNHEAARACTLGRARSSSRISTSTGSAGTAVSTADNTSSYCTPVRARQGASHCSEVDSLCSAFRSKTAIRVPREPGRAEPTAGLATGVLKTSLRTVEFCSAAKPTVSREVRNLGVELEPPGWPRAAAAAASCADTANPRPSGSSRSSCSSIPPASTGRVAGSPAGDTSFSIRSSLRGGSLGRASPTATVCSDDTVACSNSDTAAKRAAAAAAAAVPSFTFPSSRAPSSTSTTPSAGAAGPSTAAAPSTAVRAAPSVAAAPSSTAAAPGSMHTLGVVRAPRSARQELGSDVVLTPVRRSARNAASRPVTPVAEMLQATNYCYTPNAFLLRGSGATEDA